MNHSPTHSQLKMLVDNRQRHEEYAPRIKFSTLEKAVADFTALMDKTLGGEPRVCQCCEQAPTFDLTAHLLAPSRNNALAAAAAVNMLKAVQS